MKKELTLQEAAKKRVTRMDDTARVLFGRPSVSAPNLQNLVTHTELGTAIKEAFQGVQTWPPGSFKAAAEHLARAVEALPLAQWVPVDERLPECPKSAHAIGVQVLVWPHVNGSAVAFYGRRVTREPNFYLYGAVADVTHWMPLPEGPK